MKAKKIRVGYGIFLSVFTCALGIAFIAVALSIFADGNWQQGAYSSEIVAERLFPVSIVFYLWIAAIIAGFVLSVVYPYNEKTVNKIKESVTLKRLSLRTPEGSGEEYERDMRKIYVENRSRIIVYCVSAAICFAAAIASAVYMLNSAHFPTGVVVNEAMLDMFANVGPWIFAAFGACIALTLYEKYSMLKEITILKSLITSNKGNPVKAADVKPVNAVLVKIKSVCSSGYFLWSVRAAFGVIAVTFIILGIFNGGMRDVLYKAINICMECIGLG